MMRPLTRVLHLSSPLSASRPSTNSLVRILPYAGTKAVFHPNIQLTLRGQRQLFNSGNMNPSTPWYNGSSNPKQPHQQQGKTDLLGGLFGAAMVVMIGYFMYSQEQQHDRERERIKQQYDREHEGIQQQLKQAQEVAGVVGLRVFTLESMLNIVVKRLSARSGESQESIMSSAAQQTQQGMSGVKQGQMLGALEAARSKSTKV